MAKKVDGDNGGDDRVTFDAKQQELVDKLVGDARVKARELAKTEFETNLSDDQQELLETAREEAKAEAKTEFEAEATRVATAAAEEAETARLKAEKAWQALAEKHEARIAELEPLEDRVVAFEELVTTMLGTRVEILGEAAKTAIEALPEGLTDLQKLNWLNQNEGLFGEKPVGTPGPGARVTTERTVDPKVKVRAGRYPKRM